MIDFDSAFATLTGNPPFPWQQRLYRELLAGCIPSACILPTGLGKTSVMAVWLLALASDATKVPRRLVYVVNRRTVVDQSTDEAVKLRNNLDNVPAVRDALAKLCAIETKIPLAISTLRGQFADNGEWRNDPARPAIVCGTVDMIGSRLLFSGYNAGFKTRPLHAGLLGCGSLLVHDEAHLEPAFQKLLDEIVAEQAKREGKSLRVMQLTATVRGTSGTLFQLDDKDRENEIVEERLNAKKELHLHEIEEKAVPDKMIALAKERTGAVLVFARTVEAVEKIAAKLGKKVETLTGTMRGHERDQLITKPVFKRFLAKAEGGEEGTVYLVCTSAGEVGVNISADHLVCDLSTFESMAQRFGRVNRFGTRTDTQIDVVYPSDMKEDKLTPARKGTLVLLRELNGHASPAALGRLDPERREKAFAPEPVIPPVSDILFDAWSMTTVRELLPGRPPVADWLHGVAEWEPPRTQVAWREEVERFDKDVRPLYKPQDLLEDYPLKPHEILSDTTTRVFKHLETLAKRHGKSELWVIDEGKVTFPTLEDVIERGKERLEGLTLVLPPKIGGLGDSGMLDGTSDKADDVADEWYVDAGRTIRRRERRWNAEEQPPGMRLVRELFPDEGREQDEEDAPRVWRWFARTGDADDDNGSRTAGKSQELEPHNRRVGELATLIARKLGLDESLIAAFKIAGGGHDLGKNRDLWQRSIGNPDPKKPLAKSGNLAGLRWRTGYRHEFGSLSDVRSMAGFGELTDDERELVLHLIAAHHGRGRPHFPAEEAFDLNGDEEASRRLALEVPLRYAALQRKHGRWRLAMWESILRAADYLASEEGQS